MHIMYYIIYEYMCHVTHACIRSARCAGKHRICISSYDVYTASSHIYIYAHAYTYRRMYVCMYVRDRGESERERERERERKRET